MRTSRNVLLAVSVSGLLWALGGDGEAALFTFRQGVNGYTGSESLRMRDNLINGKAGDDMYVGDAGNDADNRFLLGFALSSLAGLDVDGDGTLTLTVAQVDGGPNSGDFFDAYQVNDHNPGWSRTTSSWNRLDQDSGILWKDSAGSDLPAATANVADPTLGGLGIPGQGYGTTAVATINQPSYAVNNTVDVTIPESVLQGWIDGVNAGLLFRGRDQTNAGRVRFNDPRDNNAGERPLLTFNGVIGGTPPPSVILIDDHFDNGDLGTDVNGVNGGFTKLSNGAGGAGSASEAGTNATMVTTGNDDNTGIVSNHSFDAAGTAPYGFEMSFVVTSLSSDPGNNGMFLGLQEDGTSFFRDVENFGLVFSGNESRTSSDDGFGLILNDNGSSGADVVFDDADLELGSLLDGFEATIVADLLGWSYEITGVNDVSGAPATFSGADTWVNAGLAPDFFGTFFDNQDHVSAWTQRNGTNITTMIDRITVATVGQAAVIPEPSTLLIWSLGMLGLIGFARWRKA